MGLLKKTEKTEHVSRKEFEAHAAQLESFKTITALAVAAIGFAMKAGPGMPDADPRTRLEKLSAAAGLEPQESAEMRNLFKALDRASRIESQREFAAAAWGTRTRRFGDYPAPRI